MIETIKACSYDKKSKDGKAAEDVAEFEGDDPYDDLRYAVDSAERYFQTAESEFAKVQKQEKLTQLLSENHDWTAYYRNMRQLEAANPVNQPIRRYHRARRQ